MTKRSLMVLALALMTVAPAVAQAPAREKPSTEKSKGKSQKEKEKDKDKEKDESTESARRELKTYYEKGGPRPADLPPGIARNLERGKPLPPGIERSKVPDELAAKLPKRLGEEWAMVGNRLISVDKSGIVRQVITP